MNALQVPDHVKFLVVSQHCYNNILISPPPPPPPNGLAVLIIRLIRVRGHGTCTYCIVQSHY